MGYSWLRPSRRDLGVFPWRAGRIRCSCTMWSVCWVRACLDVCSDNSLGSPRLSALSSSNWRSQRAVVHSISRSATLSTVNMNTGLTTSPTRGFPSQYIPRSSSIVFHPTEMLYGVGSPDGTGTYSILNEKETT
jgi:hypothetical protein